MIKKMLLMVFLVLALVGSVNAALLFDSNTEWVADSSNVSGFTESANAEWNISQTQAVILDTSLRTSIERIEEIKSLSITVVNVTDNGEGFLQYYPDNGQFITTYFNTSNTITVSNNGSDVEIPYNYSETIKLVMNVSVNQYQVLVNEVPQGTFNYDSGAVVPFTLKIDNGALTTGMNISYLCTDDDSTSCIGGVGPPGGPVTSTNNELTVIETNQTYYYMNISFENMTNGTVAAFSHNGSIFEEQQPTFLNSSHAEFQVNYSTPLVEVNNSNLNFQWNYAINLTNGSYDQYSIPEDTQPVHFVTFPFNLTAPIGQIGQTINATFSFDNDTDITYTNAVVEHNNTNFTANDEIGNYLAQVVLPSELNSIFHDFDTFAYFDVGFNGSTYTRNFGPVSQTTFDSDLLVCGNESNTTGLNFTLYDEPTSTMLFGDIEGFFEFTVPGSSVLVNNTFNVTNDHSLAICLYPEDAEYLVDAQLEYSSPGYDSKLYYLNGANVTNATTNIALYLNNLSTQVNFQVVDINDDTISNVTIKVLSYDIGTGISTVTEIIETDTNGDAYGQIVLNSQYYAFILTLNGEIVLETSPTIITSTTKKFRVSLTADYFDNYDITQGIAHSLTYDNTTQTFSFTYDDPSTSISTACLEVYADGISGKSSLANICNTSTTGVIEFQINDTETTDAYSAYTYAHFSGDASRFLLASLHVDFRNLHKTWGTSGIYVGFLFILFAALAFMWSPIAAVIMVDFFLILLRVVGFFELSYPALAAVLVLSVIGIGVMVKLK